MNRHISKQKKVCQMNGVPIFRILLSLLFSIQVISPTLLFGQDDKTEVKKFLLTSEEQESVLDLFHTTTEKISPEGVLEVSYDFTKDDESLGDDWAPVPTSVFGNVGKTVRWSRAAEASRVGFGDAIYFADKGQWFHRAVFEPNVSMDIHARSLVGGQRKDFFCAVFGWSKNLSRRVGSNLGNQIMRISGVKSAGAVGPAPQIVFREPHKFGYQLETGKFQMIRNGRSVSETESSKFLKGLGSGQVGCVWSGKVSMCVGEISIRGQLDFDWVGKRIPEIGKRWKAHQKAVSAKSSKS